jgi:tetratricopeptide (TPR) repeat protein
LYTFKHPLTHEVTYGTLLQDRRRALHARICAAIERLHQERLTEHVERLAHHALRAEVWDRAVTYLREAGHRAITRSAYPEAVAWLEEGVRVVHHLPEDPTTLELAIDLRFDLRMALVPLLAWARMQDCLREAETLSIRLGDQRRLAHATTSMAVQSLFAQEYDQAARLGRQALAIGQALGDLAIEAPARTHLGMACFALGQLREAAGLLRRNMETLTGVARHERFGQVAVQSGWSGAELTRVLADLGDFADAIAMAKEVVAIATEANSQYTLAFAWIGDGWTWASKGEFEEAIGVLDRSLELCRTLQFTALSAIVRFLFGFALALGGRVAEGLSVADDLAGDFTVWEFNAFRDWSLALLGHTYLAVGRLEEAETQAERALQGSRQHRARGFEAQALRLLGDIATDPNRFDARSGEAHYRDALAVAEPRGMRPLVAHCQFGLGKLYRRTGQRQEAQEHLTTATTMYREMDMRFYLEQAEAEMRDPG